MLIGSSSFVIKKMDFDLNAEPLLHTRGAWGPLFSLGSEYFSPTSRFLVVVAGSLPDRLEGGNCNIINHSYEQKKCYPPFNALLKSQMFSRKMHHSTICLTVHINESGTVPIKAI